jgi:hyperosmotically inducible protein
MNKQSLIRRSLVAAGMMLAFAAVPFSQAMASQGSAAILQSSDNQTVPDKTADAWITTKVKTEFGTTKGIHATDISVSTNDGVVTLSGTASSAKEKAHAVRVARKVKGVKSVDATGLTVDTMKSHNMKSMPSSSMSSH